MQRQYSIKLYSIYKNTIPKMSFIQHDTEVNRITFEMYNDINEPMTDISYATATVRRSDNKTYTYGSEDFIIEGNLVTFILPPSAVYLAGECVASVSVYDGNMGRLSTETFKYTVKEELIADTPIDETNEYPILTDLLERVENVPNTIAEIETLKESMQVTKEEILDLQDTLEQAEYVRQAVYDGGEVIVDKAYVSQLNDIVSQIDFLKLLKDHNEVADKLYIKKISNKTFDVCIPFRGNKVARYSIGLQVGSDDYIKMLGVSVCELKADSASSYSKDLDSKTGASLKLTVLNPEGRVWTMVAGGGASVIFADTITDLGYMSELANYGEYSGDPSEDFTYFYAKTILDLMTRKPNPKGKFLLIGGGIANFTDVASTFKGIIRALTEYQRLLQENKVKIYVRRGGPNYQQGLSQMRELGQKLGVPIEVYGPETHMTKIVSTALECES
jgi:hypothetical protein